MRRLDWLAGKTEENGPDLNCITITITLWILHRLTDKQNKGGKICTKKVRMLHKVAK